MPKITNEKKMEVVKEFLAENGIPYEESYVSGRCGVTIPIVLPSYRVAVRIGDDQDFYLKTRGVYYPIFIRNEDTKKKIREKLENTIIKSMTNYQKYLNKKRKEIG